MVVENDCDAGGFQLAQTSLLEVGTKLSVLTTIRLWEGSSPDATFLLWDRIRFPCLPKLQRSNNLTKKISGNKSDCDSSTEGGESTYRDANCIDTRTRKLIDVVLSEPGFPDNN